MKSTGIVRRIDELGRIVLPIELRRTLNIEIKDPMEIYLEGDKIVLKKHYDACIFCGGRENLTEYMGKHICGECKKNIK